MGKIATAVFVVAGFPFTLRAVDWPDKNTATPKLVQTDFGPNGSFLPGDGGDYCGPTATTMRFGYLYNAGFTQLFDGSPDYLNMVRLMGGLSGASDFGGSNAENLRTAASIYLSARGISDANRFLTPYTEGYHRTIEEIASENVEQNTLLGQIGWYQYDSNTGVYNRTGGHFIVITDQDGSAGTLTIHNSAPWSLVDVPSLPEYVQQTLPVVNFDAHVGNTSPELPTGTYLRFAVDSYIGPTQAVLEQVYTLRIDASQLPSAGFVPQDWQIDSAQALSTGGGDLSVVTRVTGAGGIQKSGEGNVVFHDEVTLTGDHTVDGGALVSTVASGEIFGTGSIALGGTGVLKILPDDSSPTDVNLAIASDPGGMATFASTVSFSGANRIELDRGANPTLSVTMGGNSGNGVANFTESGPAATLVIQANDLGATEKLRVNGSGTNLPAVSNGMVGANIVGIISSDSAEAATFLTYDATNGFIPATTTTGDINSVPASALYRATSAQTLTGDVDVLAVIVENTTIDGASNVLSVGSGSGQAGVIFNGGGISTQEMAFGANKAFVYVSDDGGSIGSALTGTSGLVKFGPGDLVVNASSPGLTGEIYVNSGQLVANATGAVGGSGNTVTVLPNASLRVNSGGSISGPTVARGYSSILVDGGTLGDVDLESAGTASNPIQGATLSGHGTIAGKLNLNGYLAADPATGAGTLTINGTVNAGAGASFIWSLQTLVDNATGVAGVNWNTLVLSDANAYFGETNEVSFLFDFDPSLDPYSGNAFWAVHHEWDLFEFSALGSADGRINISFPTAEFPEGSFGFETDGNMQVLHYYAAVPEPSVICLLAVAGGVLALSRCRRRECLEACAASLTCVRRHEISVCVVAPAGPGRPTAGGSWFPARAR